MTRNFHAHETEFNALVRMAYHDRWRIYSHAKRRLSLKRQAQYQRLISILGIKTTGLPFGSPLFPVNTITFPNSADDLVSMNVYTSGTVPAGFSKGYIYSKKPLFDVSKSPIYEEAEGSVHVTYKKISDYWYIDSIYN